MNWIGAIVKAALEALLGFFGDRQDKKQADNAQREAGAREAEAKQHDRFAEQAASAAEVRNRPAGSDDDIDRRMRASSHRTQGRPD